MTGFQLSDLAERSIEAIEDFTARTWGEAQAVTYLAGLFGEFDRIAARSVPWRRVPAAFDLDGYQRTWRSHVVYWRVLTDGRIGIVDVLHQSMDQATRVPGAFEASDFYAHPSST